MAWPDTDEKRDRHFVQDYFKVSIAFKAFVDPKLGVKKSYIVTNKTGIGGWCASIRPTSKIVQEIKNAGRILETGSEWTDKFEFDPVPFVKGLSNKKRLDCELVGPHNDKFGSLPLGESNMPALKGEEIEGIPPLMEEEKMKEFKKIP